MELENTLSRRIIVPNKSINDKRHYQAFQLSNSMQVLFVSDPQCEKSACAFSVKVGSLSDPDRSLGLAHFLEHMLFMGSSKYPSPNQYSEFISLNAGLDNAYTDDEETNYYFEIANAKFTQGVDRLAAFFKSTLLDAGCVEKERQAVHEEYVLWTNDDNCKRWGVVRHLGAGEYGRFNIGNQETLNHPDVLTDLREFYDRYYSANLMNCVLISHLSIEQMEKAYLSVLQEIPNKNVIVAPFKYPFDKNLGKTCRVQSIKDENHLEFNWIVRNLKPLYTKHIGSYLTHVLGHEGQNSLFSILKGYGWASELSSYDSDIVKATIIGLDITLTEEGVENICSIYSIVTAYVKNCLKPDARIYEQLKERNKLSFAFQEKSENYSYSSKLASRMNYVAIENILDYKIVFDEFDPRLFQDVFDELDPSRLILYISSNQAIEGAQLEPYLKTYFKLEPLPTFTPPEITFHQLRPNPYLPVDTTIYKKPESMLPLNLADNLVFAPDPRFNVCKGSISLSLYSSENQVFHELYAAWLENMLKQKLYPAEVLNVDVDIEFRNKRLNIGFFGFSDTLLKIIHSLPSIINSIFEDTEKAQQMFDLQLETLTQQYSNFYVNPTDDVLYDHISRVLVGRNTLTIEDVIAKLEVFSFEEFAEKAKKYWGSLYAQWVFVGNFTQEQIIRSKQNFERQVGIENGKNVKPAHGCLKLTQDIAYEVLIDSEDITTSGAVVYYQHGKSSLREEVVMQIIRLYIKEPFFNELRTIRQLAYYLTTIQQEYRGVLGLYFILISSSADPASISKQIKQFVSDFFSKLQAMTQKQFSDLKQGVYVKMSEPDQNLNDYANFIKNEVFGNTFRFNKKDKEVIQGLLDQISIIDVQAVIEGMLKKSLEIMVVAKNHSKSYEENRTKEKLDARIKEFKIIKDEAEYHPDYVTEICGSTISHCEGKSQSALVEAMHRNWCKNRKEVIRKRFAVRRNANS